VVALANGNYVVVNPGWHNDAAEDSGAVTWGDGTMGTIGVISGANSLVGSMLGVNTAYPSPQTTVTELNDSNYAVVSPFFYQGALTFGSATTGVRGAVSPGNSLVGGPGDLIGQHLDLFNHQYISYLTALKDGNYVVKSPDWNKGAGAVSLLAAGDCAAGLRVGSLTSANSVFGVAKNGLDINYSYDPVQHQIVVGRPADNIVTLLKVNDCAHRIFLPFVSKQ